MNEAFAHKARLAQRTAADPALCAFVAANAGSGKTTVLVNRVLRLLLDGVEPAKILCLTYTKAAAATMAVKVFEHLGQWTAMSDTELRAALFALEGREPERRRLKRARCLFAAAVETPGGLKIETIHAFCERILHLFPFEANVPARFEVLDETAAEEVMAEAKTAVLVEAATGRDTALQRAFARVSLECAGEPFEEAIRTAVSARDFLRRHRDAKSLDAAMAELAGALGLADGETAESLEAAMLAEGIDQAEWRGIAARLKRGKLQDQTRADALLEACAAADPAEKLRCYLKVFFTEQQTPRADGGRFLTQAVDGALLERMRAERDRLNDLAERRRAAAVVARTSALLTLAGAILARLEAMKVVRGALDFDDLIDKTRTLLDRSGASWILYKLDAGIDHVLIDEAQDTNPAQWEILKSLTADFTAGIGARGLRRTIFAVGDTKQSIFGFQGAEPRAFAETGAHFRRAYSAVGERFEDVKLRLSFRSTPAVLSAVDAVFGRPENFRGLSFEPDEPVGTVHESNRPRDYGRVELWPIVRPAAVADVEAWTLPVDEPDASAPPVVLADRIARTVKRWTGSGDEAGRLTAPGEILILVRKRGPLFEAIIRALKQAGVPVAGADRLRLGEHIAVLDLIVAGRAALLPDDDLTLATALKTPFVGLDDEDLVRIGARRRDDQSFVAALRAAADQRAREAVARLDEWRELAARYGPFCFYATLLGPLGARRALVSRLGPEAGDAIDEFLSLALAYERRKPASLASFLGSFGDASHEVKRDMDVARGEVRVMTVHGAKGLEAETVILADACRVDEHRPVLVPVAIEEHEGLVIPAWLPRKEEQPQRLREIREEERSREREEHNRLLYVAMTRAKDRLMVAPYLGRTPAQPQVDCWLSMVEAGLMQEAGRLAEEPFFDGDEPMRVWQGGTLRATGAGNTIVAPIENEPAWLRRKLAPEPEPEPPLRPSGAVGAAEASPIRADAGVARARLVGKLVHALLERLPGLRAEARAAAARSYVAARAAGLTRSECNGIVTDALAIIDHPQLEPLFGPASRAEVPIVGSLRLAPDLEPVSVSGQIDRLVVTPDAVLIVDFKTGANPPARLDDVSQSHLAQLALYRALLVDLFPEKPTRAFLAWTTGGVVMEIPADSLALPGAASRINVSEPKA